MGSKVGSVYIASTADTKGKEQIYVRDLIAATGLKTVTVDLSTTRPSTDARCQRR